MKRIPIDWLTLCILVVILLVLTLMGGTFWAHIAILAFMFASFATAWNILGGFAGQMSLGHAAFFGIGAYTSTLLYVNNNITPWIGIFVAAAMGSIASLIIGIPTFRLRGTYFALGTFAMGVTTQLFATHFRSLTRGGVGIPIPFKDGVIYFSFLEKWPYAIIALGILILTLVVSDIIRRSKIGYQLAAIREDQDAAQSLGINPTKLKLIAAVISGALTAVVGVFNAQYVLYISPVSTFGANNSFQPLLLAIIGGIGTVTGPAIGAMLIVPLTQLLLARFSGTLPGLNNLVYGLVLILIVLYMPGGISDFLPKLSLLGNSFTHWFKQSRSKGREIS